MRFLFVAPRFHTNQFMIIKALVDRGHEVAFFVYYQGETEDYTYVVPYLMKKSFLTNNMHRIIEKKYGPIVAEGKKSQYFIPHFFNLLRKIKDLNPDIVIVRDTTITALYVYFICKMLGIKYVILYNQIPLYSKKKRSIREKIKGIIKRIFFPRARMTSVYIDNPTKLKDHKDQYHIKKHDYFVPFIEEAREAKRTYCKNGIIRILSVGKYRDTKNHFLLVDALSLLKDVSGLSVTIVGQAYNQDEIDYYNRLEKYIKDKGFDKIITLMKNVEYSKMKDLYADHDVFTLTTKREYASIALLEAMASGMVVISTDVNGTATYIEEGKCGYIFRSMDAEDLASKIEKVIVDKEHIERMGRAASENIRKNYSSDNYYSALNDLLKKEFNLDLISPHTD